MFARWDTCFRPQRAESALKSRPSASQAAGPWARGRMVAELVHPRAATAETNVSGAVRATRRERDARAAAEEVVEALQCDQRQVTRRKRDEELPRVGSAL